MHNLNMALLSSSSSSSSPKLVIGYPTSLQNPTPSGRTLPFHLRNYLIPPHRSRISISASSSGSSSSAHPPQSHSEAARSTNSGHGNFGPSLFASISSSSGQQTSSVGVSSQPVPTAPSQVGSPLFWVGVGVAFSALFSWVASYLKKYAMQQAMKTMMNQMNTQNSQFGNVPISPFQFPMPTTSGPDTSPSRTTSSPSWPAAPSFSASSAAEVATPPPPSVSLPRATVDVSATKVEQSSATNMNNDVETKEDKKKYAFVDISPEDRETLVRTPFGSADDVNETSSLKDAPFEASQNGATFTQDARTTEGSQSTTTGPTLSVDALEKMMEDPIVQQMVYPYLPEEMRNPTTFKWMLQNPQYRQQLQDMLSNMGGNNEWDTRMVDSLKNFDLDSPEVKQQFDQIGLTPEEVISKIMANPEVAMAFQNPRVQQAIMDCSQNPMSIAKYQNDKEVMDVFNKISELFPGVTGP
ncbi:unnamed protein product [Linum trigynum]|uniref:Protein TIC 40, chloroplastic n=1 Tax=Linum trigynum TaxID=586398 RepID=A0AAV2GVQ7_9ROSI